MSPKSLSGDMEAKTKENIIVTNHVKIAVKIPVEDRELDGVLDIPRETSWIGCGMVLTHGAGGDMNFHHLEKLASHAVQTGIICLRFTCRPPNFQFRSRCYVAAVEFLRAYEDFPVTKCIIAGRSMGARVAAEVASNSSLTKDFVYGLVCLSYPLHPPRRPTELRLSALLHLGIPALFISGTKDNLCRKDLMETVLSKMGSDSTMHWISGADHELKVHRKHENEVINSMCDCVVQWCQSVFMAER